MNGVLNKVFRFIDKQLQLFPSASCSSESSPLPRAHKQSPTHNHSLGVRGVAEVMKRIPRIRFPQRHPKLSTSGTTESQANAAQGTMGTRKLSTSKSDVPAPPSTSTAGGKASLQPKRTPVSEKEIEAILLGGCI